MYRTRAALTGNVETRNMVFGRELEAETLGVVAEHLDVLEHERNKALVAALEGLFGRLGGCKCGSGALGTVQVPVASTGGDDAQRAVESSIGALLGGLGRVSADGLLGSRRR